MTSKGFVPVIRRSLMAAFVMAILSVAATVFAQTPATPPPQEQADPMKFATDKMVVFFIIKEEGVPVFEDIMSKVKGVLDKSDKAERKQQATLYRLAKLETVQGGNVTYIALLDPVVKEASYDPFKILAEGMPPAEVSALYEKLKPVLVGLSSVPFKAIMNMGGL